MALHALTWASCSWRSRGPARLGVGLVLLRRNAGLACFNSGLAFLEKGAGFIRLGAGFTHQRKNASLELGAGLRHNTTLILDASLRHDMPLKPLRWLGRGCWELRTVLLMPTVFAHHTGLLRLTLAD